MPYRYRPVQRIVTVEFVNDSRRRKEYDVRITPDQLVVRDGDTIVWDVQGLTPAQANKVSFGKFDLIEPAARVTSGKHGLQQAKAKQFPGWSATVQPPAKSVSAANRKYRATLHLDQAGLGFYKYDIMFDGRTIVDPDAEVRGPKR